MTPAAPSRQFGVRRRSGEYGVYDLQLRGTGYGFTIARNTSDAMSDADLVKAAENFVRTYREDQLI